MAEDLRGLADEELMHLVTRGDSNAFAIVYERHKTVAFSLAYRMAGRRAAAEDIVQESFLSLWRSGARYDPTRGSLRTWLLGIVHNRSIDALRRFTVHDSRRVSDEGIAERLESPERTDETVLRRGDSERVRDALQELPVEQSKVLELAYFGGFSQTEIAGMLDAPLGTVKGRMRLGLGKLREVLSDLHEVEA